MGTKRTVICIGPATGQRRHRSFLTNNGYAVLPATSCRIGLRLLGAHEVAAVVLDDGVGRDELAAAIRMKDDQPWVPVIMMADHVRVPDSLLKWVDATVAKTDPPEFLLATLHFLVNTRAAGRAVPKTRAI